MEANNNIFGYTLNPYNKKRTCGGSSGGEGAIMALNLANASMGTDIGGSLRITALFCGVNSLKPT